MMKQSRTELVFILDRSGSMGGLESDTIGGFNSLLEKQKQGEGEAAVTTVLFDDRYELLHDRIPLKAVSPITPSDYFVRGSTALLDAVGKTIHKIARAQKNTAPGYRADKVLVVITTDGMENASREFSHGAVRDLVRRQQEEYGWEFLFLGANIDAIATAERFGIARERAANYHADSGGTRVNFEAVSAAVQKVRECGELSADWKQAIDEDFESRSR